MTSYTPRAGSRTAAAVDYLQAHGGAATAIDLIDHPAHYTRHPYRGASLRTTG